MRAPHDPAYAGFHPQGAHALEPLGLAGQFLTMSVLILIGVAGLAAAIAFGLGCKDLAREFVIELLKEDKNPD